MASNKLLLLLVASSFCYSSSALIELGGCVARGSRLFGFLFRGSGLFLRLYGLLVESLVFSDLDHLSVCLTRLRIPGKRRFIILPFEHPLGIGFALLCSIPWSFCPLFQRTGLLFRQEHLSASSISFFSCRLYIRLTP